MPANLTQQYHKAEQEYRRASTPDDELRLLLRPRGVDAGVRMEELRSSLFDRMARELERRFGELPPRFSELARRGKSPL